MRLGLFGTPRKAGFALSIPGDSHLLIGCLT
jgi:hypothetical protein